jgi:predicted protein tyrosine phosphatase
MMNCRNPYQGDTKKVLCLCSAGLLRSPTAANTLHKKYGYNTRAAGVDEGHALIPVDLVLLAWADEVVCMSAQQENVVRWLYDKNDMAAPKIKCLHIPDSFGYMDPELVELIEKKYEPN